VPTDEGVVENLTSTRDKIILQYISGILISFYKLVMWS